MKEVGYSCPDPLILIATAIVTFTLLVGITTVGTYRLHRGFRYLPGSQQSADEVGYLALGNTNGPWYNVATYPICRNACSHCPQLLGIWVDTWA